MAIKNLFGRGLGFGAVHWIVTHGYDSGAPVVVGDKPPSPTRLAFDLTATVLAFDLDTTLLAFDLQPTRLAFLGDDGFTMSVPLIFTQNETGAITLSCTGADGTAENLATASAVTFTMQNTATGVVKVNAVALTGGTADGDATWTRLAAQVDTAGDYVGQVKVVRADATIGYFPDGQTGSSITILKAVGS